MTSLAELQSKIQGSVLAGNDAAASLVANPPRGSRSDRLAVYNRAYLLRLAEFLANDYEKLRLYLGEMRFTAMAKAYAAAHPSDTPNARWFSRHLPEFLAIAPDYRRRPEVSELARLERALNDAFDGPDAPIVTIADLAAIPPEEFGGTSFDLAPTVFRFAVTTNVTGIWAALKCEEKPPSALDLAEPAEIMVWRQSSGSRFRILGAEEAMAIGSVGQGLAFSAICEMIATFDDPEGAAYRAASYLRGWIEAEIIARARLPGGEEK